MEAARVGIDKHLLGGVDPEDWRRQHKIASRFPGRMRVSFGLHPWWVAQHENNECEEAMKILDEMLHAYTKDDREDIRPWAIGETGLDFHERFGSDTHERQIHFFREHLSRARVLDLPLILHVVRAHEPALETLEKAVGEVKTRSVASQSAFRGIIHSFSGGVDVALRYRRLGFLLSISASVLTRGSGKAFDSLRSAVLSLEPKDFVLETDAPDQPPAAQKGQMNRPIALLDVAKAISAIRGGSQEEWLLSSSQNLRREFGV